MNEPYGFGNSIPDLLYRRENVSLWRIAKQVLHNTRYFNLAALYESDITPSLIDLILLKTFLTYDKIKKNKKEKPMSIFDIFKKLESSRPSSAPIEFIIAGLGNPGTKYEDTRHNCGFMAVETLAEQHGTQIKRLRFKSLTAEVKIGGKGCLLMKPTTFMNNSGDAIEEAAGFYKISPENILIIYDDINLDVGRLRIRAKGSDGGHNGMKSIILRLNTDAFPRIRIGVGKKPHPDYDLADWVLSRFTKEEGTLLEPALINAAKAAEMIAGGKTDDAMNVYNRG